jgi:very-short-patch-repair endonuclease
MARRFRKSMTKPELWLWLRLRGRLPNELVFRNQHPLGRYVLDFYCPKAKLCVEVDGEVHTYDRQIAKDAERDVWLAEHDIMVYRIAAGELLANPDETADSVISVAETRFQSLKPRTKRAPPTAFGGPPSP